MLDFETARARVLELARRHSRAQDETKELDEAEGGCLAEDVEASEPFPRADTSAMDGYAVGTRDFEGAGPWTFQVVGECRTGHEAPEFVPRAALRIFTGAAVPEGADAVVMQENVERRGDFVTFTRSPRPGDNVRRAGEDLERGSRALARGARLGAFQLGLLAMLDRPTVRVAARPRVAIVCTGDELTAPGTPRTRDQLPESNGTGLAALVRHAGGVPVRGPIVRDELELVIQELRSRIEGEGRVDVVLTVGGVSVGDHDVVKPALEALGARVDFWKVSMKPGKPLLVAELGDVIVMGLPGNPASAQITFSLFGVPLLRALQGDRAPLPPVRRAPLVREFRQKPGRTQFLRASWTTKGVEVFDNQSSGAATALAWANALAVIPQDAEIVRAGSDVDVLLFSEM